MEPIGRLMGIIDTYSEVMSDNDYLQACNILKKLHSIHKPVPRRRLSINEKMKMLLHKIVEVDPDMVPIFAPPYIHSQIEYAEWICSELHIDVDQLYATSGRPYI